MLCADVYAGAVCFLLMTIILFNMATGSFRFVFIIKSRSTIKSIYIKPYRTPKCGVTNAFVSELNYGYSDVAGCVRGKEPAQRTEEVPVSGLADVAPYIFHLQFYSQSTNMRQQQELTPKNRKTNVLVSVSRATNDRFNSTCTAVALPTFNCASSVGCVGTHASVHTFLWNGLCIAPVEKLY